MNTLVNNGAQLVHYSLTSIPLTVICQCTRHVQTRVCISGYPLSGYPDLSINFMAAKNPDILK